MTATIVVAIAFSVLGPAYQLWRARTSRRNFASLTKHVFVLILVELICLVVSGLIWRLTLSLHLALLPTLVAVLIGGIVVGETGRHPWTWRRRRAHGAFADVAAATRSWQHPAQTRPTLDVSAQWDA